MKISIVLKKTRAKIATPGKWIKGSYFCDGAYCLSGALYRAHPRTPSRILEGAGQLLCDMSPTGSVISFNDHPDTTHGDVLLFLDGCIGISEAEGV